jgi:DNA-directed RNA polymerase specialized sigma24 family protein
VRGPASTDIAFYEGLVRKTAAMIAPSVQEDYDDIVAILRIKVWRALVAFDPARARQPVERYVFMCVTNQKKDLLKRKRRYEVPLDDEYDVRVDSDVVYGEVEDVTPVIPCTLSSFERDLVTRLYLGYTERQVAGLLGLTRPQMERALEAVRVKMADWRPTAAPVLAPPCIAPQAAFAVSAANTC